MTNYKGYTIAKYLNEKCGVRWSVEDEQGNELIFDQTKKYLCTRYIDSLVRDNLQKRDLSQAQAFTVYSKINAAYELGNFEDAVKLNGTYERLVSNAIMWEQKELSA